MADKEERIWIDTTEKKIQLKQMTRQEAIERMAKAICKISCACKYYSCGNCTEFLEHYQPEIAEAALNALLEVQK